VFIGVYLWFLLLVLLLWLRNAMDLNQQIADFLADGPFAVAGASSDREKYGNKVLRALVAAGYEVYPLNPRQTEVEGLRCYPDVARTPKPVRSLSIVTPPEVTEQIVEQAAAAGVQNVWMQPGAESPRAIEAAQRLGLNVIAGGPCLLVTLATRRK
jgi:predicted CoA-binding protein